MLSRDEQQELQSNEKRKKEQKGKKEQKYDTHKMA